MNYFASSHIRKYAKTLLVESNMYACLFWPISSAGKIFSNSEASYNPVVEPVGSCNILVRSTDPWPRKSHFEVFCYRGKNTAYQIVLTFFIRNIFGIWKAFTATLVSIYFFNTRFLRDIADAMIYKKLHDYLNFFQKLINQKQSRPFMENLESIPKLNK